jgi:hypothetical protein
MKEKNILPLTTRGAPRAAGKAGAAGAAKNVNE